MKDTICTISGVIGGFIAALFSGWDSALVTLLIFMGVDFATGFVTAAMGKSKHSETGKLSSTAGWVGLAKKFCILLMVVVAVRIDIMLGTTYIRDAVCIGFCVNELLSIMENTSLAGIPYPDVLKKALDVLQKKAGRTDENAQKNLEQHEKEEQQDD